MTQEVSLARLHCATICEPKGKASRTLSRCTGQMAFYKELSDRQSTSFSGQRPAPWAATTSFLAQSEPKTNTSSPSLVPNPLYSVPLTPARGIIGRLLNDKGGEQVCRWLRSIVFPISMLLYSFSKNLPEVIPCRNSLLIQASFPPLHHVSREAPDKGWPAASVSVLFLCIQSLVSLLFLGSGSSLAAVPSSGQVNATVLLGQLCSAFSLKPWLVDLVLTSLPCLKLCCFLWKCGLP